MKITIHKFIKKLKSKILSIFVKLTPVTDKDCRDIYEWRNDELNRRYSLNSDMIQWETHRNWFASRIGSQEHQILIASILQKKIGVLIFNIEVDFCEVSIYLVPGNHGKGYGLCLLYAAVAWIKKNIDFKKLTAKILPENKASISIFRDAGFEYMSTEKNYELWQRSIS